MGNLKKKKYGTGEAANYITRKQAMKKLQLSLKVRKTTQSSCLVKLFIQDSFRTFDDYAF